MSESVEVLPTRGDLDDPTYIFHVYCPCQIGTDTPVALCGHHMPEGGTFLPHGVCPPSRCVVCWDLRYSVCRVCDL